ncbi:AAA family ATPase [Oceanirhabdus sp. W0125-5]|uniref:AAA family ATPase n=1 Tax=Oceanirhabdus sp. W0125-5 TaxID=2999116 RepID=UPI0022F2CB5A|nr:P-loop NTPase [Oceanirhabdus sp. W0125-5]WBW95542.1 P-loop NTPase [Oceanirhabdus sp. W0125-5]
MDVNEVIHETTERKKGEMIVFASAKGGVGKTIISVNIAVALAKKGFSTCILDGNFQFGDVNLALDLQPKLTISDLIHDIDSLNSDILSNYLQKHESGVKVLSAPVKPEYADLITPPVIERVCDELLENNRFLIVDLSSGLSEHNISFMEKANKIMLITDLEMAALKNTKAMLKTIKALDLEEKTKIIINRGDMESVIKFKDTKNILNVEDLYFISDNFKVVSKSFNIGIPFVMSKPKEKISNEIGNLAVQLYRSNTLVKRRRRRHKKTSLFSVFKKNK